MTQIDDAVQHLEKFRHTNSLEELDQAVAELEAADVGNGTGIEREAATRAWISVFDALDQFLDSAFNPSDVPAINVIPPAVNGVTYPSGVHPNAISDQAARAQYEEQLSENQAKSERYNFQYGLQSIDRRVTASFEMYVSRFYSPSASDRAELERLVREGGLSAARSEHIIESTRAP